MKRVVVLALACLVIGLYSSPADARRIVYAVAIGNNQPPGDEANVQPLRYADDDAVRYFDLFRRAGDRVMLLTVFDRPSERRYGALVKDARLPTLAELFQALTTFRLQMVRDKARGDEPVLFIAYSGHGAHDETKGYYLSFLDGKLTQEALYDQALEPLKEFEVHLIVDACNAAGVLGVRGAFDKERDAQPVRLDTQARDGLLRKMSLARFPLTGALVAASSGQEAHEWSRIESGVFTHEVLSALAGPADVNGDLRIEYSEVAAYIASANHGVADPRAVPEVVAHPPSAHPHAPLLDLLALNGSRLLTATGNDLGRFSVDMPDGSRFADGHASGSTRVVIAMPRVAGAFLRRGDSEAEIPQLSLIHFADLSFSARRTAARGSMDRLLREQLFSEPFSRAYYHGFVDSHDTPSVVFDTPPREIPESDDGSRTSLLGRGPQWLAPALVVTAGVAAATTCISALLALEARHRFDETTSPRRANEIRNEYELYGTIAGLSAVGAGVAGVAAVLTWPRDGGRPSASLVYQASF